MPRGETTHKTEERPQTGNNTSFVEAERAVRAVLDEIYAAWANNDADAFVAPYAEAATAVLPGTYLPDREAIRAPWRRFSPVN